MAASVPISNFYIQRGISKWGKDTYVNWAKNDVSKAIVFIHGFNGSSLGTFGNFNLDFRYRPEYKEYDVYFFSYDSLFDQITNSALDFLHFLKAIHNNISSVIEESGIDIQRTTSYSKIVIVAHSLGAVVARQALNDGYDDGENWLDKCELVLFAPAHIGARDELDSFINFPGYIKCMGPLIRLYVLTLKQLMDPSIILEPLQQKCEMLIKQNVTSFTIAKKVIWASPERVVINRKFLKDPTAVQFKRRTHSEVCKPTDRFTRPFDELAKLL